MVIQRLQGEQMLTHWIIRGWWITVVLLCLFILPLLATPYSNVGEAYELGMGARPVAMGGAFVGLIDDEGALSSNPANLTWGEKLTVLSTLQTRLATASSGDILASFNNFAVGAHYFDFGDVPETDEFGNVVGSFSYRNYTLITATGVKAADLPFLDRMPFADSVGFGISAKFLKISTLEPGSGSGLALDLPFLFRTTMPSSRLPFITSYGAGLVIENILSVPIQYESGHTESWRRKVLVGCSLEIADQVILAIDATSENSLGFGAEWTPIPSVSFRGGLRREEIWMWSLGMGLRYRNFAFDYAVVLHPYLNSELRASLGVQWQRLT